MKLVNPLGRNVSGEAYTGNGAEPAACMCSGSSSYARARGTDKCFKCGCSCSSATYSAGNSKTAFWTVRKSGHIE